MKVITGVIVGVLLFTASPVNAQVLSESQKQALIVELTQLINDLIRQLQEKIVEESKKISEPETETKTSSYVDHESIEIEKRISSTWGRNYESYKDTGTFNFSDGLKESTDNWITEYKVYNPSFDYPRFAGLEEAVEEDPSLTYALDPVSFAKHWEAWIKSKYGKKFDLLDYDNDFFENLK